MLPVSCDMHLPMSKSWTAGMCPFYLSINLETTGTQVVLPSPCLGSSMLFLKSETETSSVQGLGFDVLNQVTL